MTDKKYNVTVAQNSGLNSDSSQKQQVQIGDNHYHIDQYKTYEKLVSIHQSPITFDPSSFKEIIVSIEAGINIIDEELIDFTTSVNINQKNEINNHSKEFFEDFVELDFYPQFYKLDRFFELKEIQRSIQPKVDNLIKSLNRQIRAFQGPEKFESILLKITAKLIDTNYDQLKNKENEILLILYYFYCNCCIGKKTKEENASS
jgi:hypothetical protein